MIVRESLCKTVRAVADDCTTIVAGKPCKIFRWINPKEQLPMPEEIVLVIVSGNPKQNITLDNAYELASFSVDEGWILEEWPEWEDPDVKYWIPLPEPPKEVICDE